MYDSRACSTKSEMPNKQASEPLVWHLICRAAGAEVVHETLYNHFLRIPSVGAPRPHRATARRARAASRARPAAPSPTPPVDDNDDDVVVHDVIQTFRSNTEAETTCCFLFSKIEC